MKTAFLDANVLWSAATNPQSDLARKLDNFPGHLLTSNYCIRETERNLKEDKSLEELRRRLEQMKIVPDAFGPPPGVELAGKDVPVLAAAALAGADFLVTGDQKHFGKLYGKTFGKTKVIRPRDV